MLENYGSGYGYDSAENFGCVSLLWLYILYIYNKVYISMRVSVYEDVCNKNTRSTLTLS